MRKYSGSVREDGFTIMELMVVVLLASVIMAIATPSYTVWLRSYRLTAGARQVASDMQLARMKAISQNTQYRLNFQSSTTYVFEKDAGFVLESGPFTLTEGVTTSTGPTVVFQARGTASAAGQVTLTNPSGTKLVCIKAVGRVFIADASC